MRNGIFLQESSADISSSSPHTDQQATQLEKQRFNAPKEASKSSTVVNSFSLDKQYTVEIDDAPADEDKTDTLPKFEQEKSEDVLEADPEGVTPLPKTIAETLAYNAAVSKVGQLHKAVTNGATDDPVAQLNYFENLTELVAALDSVPEELGSAKDQSTLITQAAELIKEQFEAAVSQAIQAAISDKYKYQTKYQLEYQANTENKSQKMSVMELAASMHSKNPSPVFTHDEKSLPQFFGVLAFIANCAIFMNAVFSSNTFENLAKTRNPNSKKGETYDGTLFRFKAILTKLQRVFSNPPDVKAASFFSWNKKVANPLTNRYSLHFSALICGDESDFDTVFPQPKFEEVVAENPYSEQSAVAIYETAAKPLQNKKIRHQDLLNAINALDYLASKASPEDKLRQVSVGGDNLEAGMAALAVHIIDNLLPLPAFRQDPAFRQEELSPGFLALTKRSANQSDHEHPVASFSK